MAAQMKEQNQISKTIVAESHDPKRKTIRSDHKYFRFWNLYQNITIMKNKPHVILQIAKIRWKLHDQKSKFEKQAQKKSVFVDPATD